MKMKLRKLNAMAPWYGSKRQLAPRIIPLFGKHFAFWDIMCGSCAIPLAKENCRMTVINDLNGAVVNLARVVADDVMSILLFERLYRTAFCEELYLDSVDWLKAMKAPQDHPLEWAYHYFILSWQGRNGLVGTVGEHKTGFCKRYNANGGDPATRFRGVVANVPAWWEKMREWTILSEDSIGLCSHIEDKDGVVAYCDPPYLDKQAKYIHDFDDDMHVRLAESLRRFKQTRAYVSYYDHPLLEDLYLKHGWVAIRMDVQKNLSVTAGAKKAPEVLLVNQPAQMEAAA